MISNLFRLLVLFSVLCLVRCFIIQEPKKLIQQLDDYIPAVPIALARWYDDDHLLYYKDGHIFMYDVRTEIEQEPSAGLKKVFFGLPNSDYSYAAFKRSPVNDAVERTSFDYKFVRTKDLKESTISGAPGVQAFDWAPQSTGFAYVKEGQLYVGNHPAELNSIHASKLNPHQINGVHDWVYTEEISHRSNLAFWWSTDSTQIAFVSYDPNVVEKMRMPNYPKDKRYPIDVVFSYPKVNTTHLPIYSLNIYDRTVNEMKTMRVERREFQYLFAVTSHSIHGESVFVAVWANRFQNEVSLTLCAFDTGMCHLVFEYKYQPRQWSEPEHFQHMVSTKSSLFFVLPRENPDGNMYDNVVRLDIPSDWRSSKKATLVKLPPAPYDVDEILMEKDGYILYKTAAPTPSDMHAYAMPTAPLLGNSSHTHFCVTCFSDDCRLQKNIKFSPNSTRVYLECRGPDNLYVVHGVLVNNKLEKISSAITPPEFRESYSKYVYPYVIHDDIVLDNGYVARTKLMLPHAAPFDKPVPVMLTVYGGPGFNRVDFEKTFDMDTHYATARGMAIIYVDVRGSGRRGWKYRSPIYGAMGTVEMEDHVSALAKLLEKHPYLDKKNVLVYGWSYGGFTSVNVVELAPPGMFKCAISIAPVSNFIYYDATYSERYMGNTSRAAYYRSDMTRDVSKFRTTRLLLMHGLADDNVHFQNAAIFIKKMQDENIDFDLMVYPDRNHGLGPGNFALLKTSNFINKCLLEKSLF